MQALSLFGEGRTAWQPSLFHCLVPALELCLGMDGWMRISSRAPPPQRINNTEVVQVILLIGSSSGSAATGKLLGYTELLTMWLF